jgi:hypothetical protein
MRHLKAVNQKANRIQAYVAWEAEQAEASARLADDARPADGDMDVVGLQRPPHEENGPHFPLGCSLVFSPGWEVDSQGGTAGLCQPVERDIFDCHLGCFWPAHVPDQLNHAPDWTGKCASAQKDWRKLDLIFP